MSRNRACQANYPTITYSDQGGFPITEISGNLEYGLSRNEYFTDEEVLTKPQHFKPCFHRTQVASIISKVSKPILRDGDSGYIEVFMHAMRWNGTLPVPAIDWDDLVVSLSDDVRSILRTKSLLMVTIAEAVKTWRMVKNPFSLLNLFRGRYGMDNHTLLSLSKSASGKWLEARYGWRPLYGDIKNLSKAMVKLNEVNKHHDELRGGSSKRFGRSRNIAVNSSSRWPMTEAEWTYYVQHPFFGATGGGLHEVRFGPCETTFNVSCTRYQPAITPLAMSSAFVQAFGLDTESILPTLWEIMPYSFVLDWFFNTNGMLHPLARRVFDEESLTRIGYSVKTEVSFVVDYLSGIPNGQTGYIDWMGGDPIYYGSPGKTTEYTRTAGLPVNESIFSGQDLSLIHTLDGLGLIIQRLIQ